ncbi:hypothetical protein OMP38_03570 [Cohnella ginsengisoli]|uniref:Uncharacterized protein n=1 Tax=Cohnella ginsengisoli TaxID=425004 RepID=A0A9X4KDJ8_9BACL|nr:hypothetical protein [Cohnella ginsengisoli]MDG0790032.1 hypothetical protein [Cohnella ginsengisoli]
MIAELFQLEKGAITSPARDGAKPAVRPTRTFYAASAGFSSTQGSGGWFYQAWNGSAYTNLSTYKAGSAVWQSAGTDLLVGSNFQHPRYERVGAQVGCAGRRNDRHCRHG